MHAVKDTVYIDINKISLAPSTKAVSALEHATVKLYTFKVSVRMHTKNGKGSMSSVRKSVQTRSVQIYRIRKIPYTQKKTDILDGRIAECIKLGHQVKVIILNILVLYIVREW